MQDPIEIPLQPAAKLHLLFDSKATVASVKSFSAFPTAFVLGTSLLPWQAQSNFAKIKTETETK